MGVLAVAVLILIGAANFALADLPTGQPITQSEIEDMIATVANFLLIAGVILAVIFIVIAGIKYMYAGSDSTKVGEAQTMLKNGIIGAAIVMGVGVIIQTIAALIGRQFFNF